MSILEVDSIILILVRIKHICIAAIFMILAKTIEAQTDNTVGLILNTEDSYNGYTMLAPTSSTNTYLIDNCGYVINIWESDYGPGLAAHLTPWGTMIRSGRINNSFQAGGSGGLIQEFDWDGNVLWQSAVSTFQYQQHHDVKPMSNGNILVLAWEYNSPIDAVLLGRNPELITDDGIWTEMLFEIEPVGTSDYLVKWEWHLKDHLIQDIDSDANNFGIISEHPELVDLNYPHGSLVDLFHANALDYNEERDHIVINSRNYNEFYIIDHSTTTAEAAGHEGGNSGKGGDILYRYGNPATYGRGESEDQKFYHQHGSNWIGDGVYKNSIIVFNNGIDRPQGQFSSVEIVTPTWNGQTYDVGLNSAFGPDNFSFAYVGTPTTDFFSPRISNATVLPNGNILVCNGQIGELFEINQEKEIIWEYINPVLGNSIVQQGDNSPEANVFSTHRYPMDYSGLPVGLISGNPIESNSVYDCEIFEEEVNVFDNVIPGVRLVQNPIADQLIIDNDKSFTLQCSIYDVFGRQVIPTFESYDTRIYYPVDLKSGYYILKTRNETSNSEFTHRFIKG